MYDYGARFYDPSLSLWNSVDPLTGDMPDHGAYNYTFQNRIMYNDPTGMKGEGVDDIIVNGQKWAHGVEYEGSDEFGKKVFDSLNNIADSSESGRKGLNELANSDFDYTIKEVTGDDKSKFVSDLKDKYKGQDHIPEKGGGAIYLNFNNPSEKITTAGLESDIEATIIHELIGHGIDANRGKLDYGVDKSKSTFISVGEFSASYRENVIRGEMNKPLRVSYGQNESGTVGYGYLIRYDKKRGGYVEPFKGGRMIRKGGKYRKNKRMYKN